LIEANLPEPAPRPGRPFDILSRRKGGRGRALALIEEISSEFGVRMQVGLNGTEPDQVLSAIALIRSGSTPESVSSHLTWQEFESFSASVLRANGYSVKTSVVLTKPRRQLDIVAESQTLALSVDCKHWARPFSMSSMEQVARDQIERTIHYKEKRPTGAPMLPAVFTILDPPVRDMLGVPFVPVFAVRDFLASVSRFDEGLAII
jgi:hypothetical protein